LVFSLFLWFADFLLSKVYYTVLLLSAISGLDFLGLAPFRVQVLREPLVSAFLEQWQAPQGTGGGAATL
jgi:hypothetical protein